MKIKLPVENFKYKDGELEIELANTDFDVLIEQIIKEKTTYKILEELHSQDAEDFFQHVIEFLEDMDGDDDDDDDTE